MYQQASQRIPVVSFVCTTVPMDVITLQLFVLDICWLFYKIVYELSTVKICF